LPFFDDKSPYREQAWNCLVDSIIGTPVNDAAFTKRGSELGLLEYQYVLREADISHEVWTVTTAYAQQYNWKTRRGVWANEGALADHVKLDYQEYLDAQEKAFEMEWIVLGKDWRTGKQAIFPAMGQTLYPRPQK
jgi:hypothetical protein